MRRAQNRQHFAARASVIGLLLGMMAANGAVAAEGKDNVTAQSIAMTSAPTLSQDPAAPPKIKIGVGRILNTYDNTSESFNLLAYLQAHFPQSNTPPVEFVFVDHYSDVDFAVTGQVTARYGHTFHLGMDRRPRGMRSHLQDEASRGAPGASARTHEFTYQYALDFALWKAGRKVDKFQASPAAPHAGIPNEVVKGTVKAETYDGIRMKLLAPVWKELATRIEQHVRTEAMRKEGK
jgi:hypothetical protein